MSDKSYFYHSFPRRGNQTNSEIEKGCKILESIRDNGLLLNPELIEWRQPNNSGIDRVFRVLQTRACFTELKTTELPGHSEKFGHFSLEFECETIRKFGAVPVFYIPQHYNGGLDGSAVGVSLISIISDAEALIHRITDLQNKINRASNKFTYTTGFTNGPQKTVTLDKNNTSDFISALGHQITPWSDLYGGIKALKNFFYPTDNQRSDSALEYYKQREWRMACSYNINRDGIVENLFHHPNPAQKNILLNIDSEFFGRIIVTDEGNKNTLDECLIFPGYGEQTVIEMVKRIIVPDEALQKVNEIFSETKNKPLIIPISHI